MSDLIISIGILIFWIGLFFVWRNNQVYNYFLKMDSLIAKANEILKKSGSSEEDLLRYDDISTYWFYLTRFWIDLSSQYKDKEKKIEFIIGRKIL